MSKLIKRTLHSDAWLWGIGSIWNLSGDSSWIDDYMKGSDMTDISSDIEAIGDDMKGVIKNIRS